MGGGASRAKRRKDAKALEAGAQTGLSPAVIRRRKVLFGNAGLQSFERVSARNQFTDFPEFADSEQQSALREDQDLVFERVGVSVANEFRTRALQICNADFLLGPHSIELLGLGIGTGSAISNRLFKIGQVGRHIPPGGSAELPEPPLKEPIPPRPDALTCYELLALFSVIRAGTHDELLELLFCVFDADEDDKVSAKDFEAAIVSYLEMEGQTGLEGAELDAYRKVNPKDKTQAARRVAELVVSKYGSGVELPPDVLPAGEECCDEHHDALAPAAKPKAQPRKSWLCLCAGKPPHDDKDGEDGKGGKDDKKKPLLDEEDSDGSGYSSDAGRKAKKKMQEAAQKGKAAEAAPKKKSRFPSFSPRRSTPKKKDADDKDKLLGEKDGDEEDSGIKASKETHGSEGSEGGPQQPEAKETKSDMTAPKKKAAPKRTKAGCCPVCRGKAKRPTLSKQPPPPLSFAQWRTWFDEQFADFVLPDSKGAPPVMGQGYEPKTVLPSGPPAVPPGPLPTLTHGDTIMDMDANKSAGAGPPFGRSGSLKGNAGGDTGIKQFRTTDDDEDSGADSDVPDSLRKMQQQALIG